MNNEQSTANITLYITNKEASLTIPAALQLLCALSLPTAITNLQAKSADAALKSLEAAQELVEPTVVLQFPSQAASGMHHIQAAACPTDTAAQAQEDSMSNRATAQHPAHSQGTDCCAAQDCSRMAGSLDHSILAQPEQVKLVHGHLAPCLQPMAAASQSPEGNVQQQSDAGRTVEAAMLPGGTVAFADGQQATGPDGQTGSPEGQATPPEGQAASPEGQATAHDGQTGRSEGQATALDGQTGSPEGHATAPDGQTGSQTPVVTQQTGGTEGQAAVADGQTDWQGSAAADGHDATADKHTALTNGVPAHLSDTISEACCVCNSAEDGEVMLLCDKCDQPAHLGCVGVDIVPEGDWFCPSCISVMVHTLPTCGTRTHSMLTDHSMTAQ